MISVLRTRFPIVKQQTKKIANQIPHLRYLSNSSSPSKIPAPQPSSAKRFSAEWFKDQAIVMTVFGITGSSTMALVRPSLSMLGLAGSMWDGPWSYRIAYLTITLPLYSAILISVGTLFNRGLFFRQVVFRMYGRLLPSNARDSLRRALKIPAQ